MAFMTAGCTAHMQSIRGVSWLRDDRLPDIKSRVVTDGRTYRRTDKNRLSDYSNPLPTLCGEG